MERSELHSLSNSLEALTCQTSPEVLVFETAAQVDAYAAARLKEQVLIKPTSVLTLPTGNTPLGMYEHIAELAHQGEIDLSNVTIFNLDEYYPISPSHPSSYASYMRSHLVDQTAIGTWHIPNGIAVDPTEEAERYKALLDDSQPVDLAILGIGPGTTCHIGFNERGSSSDSTIRYVPLDPETREANSRLFENPGDIPVGAITQGIADILRAKQIIVIAKGISKAWGIKRALTGDISSDAPASFLRLHPNVTFILDKEAAQYLTDGNNELQAIKERLPARLDTIFFDLDGVLIPEGSDDTLTAMSDFLPNNSLATPDAFVQAVRDSMQELWEQMPMLNFVSTLGLTPTEALRMAEYTGTDVRMQEFYEWAKDFQNTVWTKVLATFGIHDVSLTQRLLKTFQEEKRLTYRALPGTHDILRILKERYKLCLVTNGAPDLQRLKIQEARLEQYFGDNIIISGEVGIGKPDPQIFGIALEKVSGASETTIMIGNSFDIDIQGSIHSNILGILLDNDNRTHAGLYENSIHSLADILEIL